jgi:TonB family protein
MTFPGSYPSLFWLSMGFSLTFHVFFFLFLSEIAELFQRTPRGIPVTIQIVSTPSPAPPSSASLPSPPSLPAKPEEKPSSPSPQPPEKKKETTLHKPQTTHLRKPPPQKRTQTPRNPASTLKEIRELLKSYTPGGAVAGSGLSSTDLTGYELPPGIEGKLYFREVISAIQSVWKIPPGKHKNTVEMEILLDPQGKLLFWNLTRGSGDSLLDRSAQTAILSAPFPPPPSGWRTPLRLRLILIPPEVP